ncbi:MAG: 3-dehydroquinate synthase II [Candidatus Ranarchaeia archaeon]
MKDIGKIIFHIKEYNRELITDVLEHGINYFFTDDSEIVEKIRSLGSVIIISNTEEVKPDLLIGKDIEKKIIQSKDDEIEVSKSKAPIILIETSDWRIIPLENIISQLEGSSKKTIVKAKNIDDAELLLTTLEKGVDTVILTLSKKIDYQKLWARLIEKKNIPLVSLKIKQIKNVGMGERVCIDTCSILAKGEGMLVGSQSNGLFLIHNENVDSPYADPRPFRVNAGAIHSYVLQPDMKTKYLIELKGGTRVLICDQKGNGRSVTIGRAKVEKRPLMMILAESVINNKTKEFQVIVQNAETIRLVRSDKDSSLVSVVNLKVGDTVLGYVEEGGRHFGQKITESIKES